MKYIFLSMGLFILIGCSKTSSSNQNQSTVNNPTPSTPAGSVPKIIIYPINTLDSFSTINKTTSWYNTTIAMTSLFDVFLSKYWGFEFTSTKLLIPYNTTTTNTWSASKNYYWNDLGTYLYTDFTGDGKKDLWAFYWKNPWPTNATGLHLFSEYEYNPSTYDIQVGLTQVRKCVVSDMDNDKKPDIMLFSSGYDGMPFPGDSLAIFYPNDIKYQYLNQDIGYYHGGATGDINNDGLIDIVAYSGGSAVIPTHPTSYLNKGNRKFELNKQIFKNFNQGSDNYYTVELFDINNDSNLDLFLGSSKTLRAIPGLNGLFDRTKAINFPVDSNLELMDIAFLDFDFDGKIDVLTMSNKNGYNGYGLRLFLNKGTSFVDSTSTYFDVTDEVGNGAWIKWIRLFDYDGDGDLDVVADGLFGDLHGDQGRKIYWRNDSGKFKQVKL
ncbi:MAG: VCBS repeat-containing protein [Chitinophagia bacterium]